MVTLADQVIVVTGAGRGLGEAYAHLLAGRGATVILHDGGVQRDGTGPDPTVATTAANRIVKQGGRAEPETQDLSTQHGCEQLVASVLARHGRIDGLVHNAGIVRYVGIADTTDEEFARLLAVNVSAAWWLCRAVWSPMAARRYGRIVLTTSGFALRPIPGADVTAYSLTKGAQFGLMNALAAEGRPLGILVNAVSPIAATRIFRRPTAPGELSAESVAPGVAVLVSPDCPAAGLVLVAAGGTWALDAMSRTDDVDLGAAADPDDVLRLLRSQLPRLPAL